MMLCALGAIHGGTCAAQDPNDGAECVSCGFGRVVVEDTRDIFKAPTRWGKAEWRTVAVEAAIVAGSMAWLDESARDYVQDRTGGTATRISDAVAPFGREYLAGVLGGFALVGLLADKPVARRMAMDGLVSAVITSGLVVPALKEITGRSRPRTDQGAGDFNPFSGAASFPSGDVAAAFAIATAVAENNDQRWVRIVSYGLAGLVAYSRMEHDAHWLSDVTAGAFIGTAIARRVVELERHRRGIVFAPVNDGETWGIRITKAF